MMKKTPLFCLNDQNNTEHCLEKYLGSWVLVYFYPKDSTPGCTKEACTFRDSWGDLKEKGIVVFGISADSTESHKKFAEKHNLPFPILSDTDKSVAKLYGVLRQKIMFGKTFSGIVRESFLVNPTGEIVKHYEKVKPAEHAAQVLIDVEKLR